MKPSNEVLATSSSRQGQQLGYLQDRRGTQIIINLNYLIVVIAAVSFTCQRQGQAVVLLTLGLLGLWNVEYITRIPRINPWKFVLNFSEQRKAPLLICLGDSITHGRMGADWVSQILPGVVRKIKYPGTLSRHALFQYPLYVVNAGQNSMTTHVVLRERIKPVVECQPDYVVVMIGTNDMLGMFKPFIGGFLGRIWKLDPEEISWETFERNIHEILERLLASKSGNKKTKVAICTLPPLGEDLTHPANQVVKKANTIIQKVADSYKKKKALCTVLPVFETMEARLLKELNPQKQPTFWRTKVDHFFVYMFMMSPFRTICGMKWNDIARFVGHKLLVDGVHTTEVGGEIISNLVIQWLVDEKVEEAIKDVW